MGILSINNDQNTRGTLDLDKEKERKIDELQQYRNDLRELREYLADNKAQDIDADRIKSTLRHYQEEYNDIRPYLSDNCVMSSNFTVASTDKEAIHRQRINYLSAWIRETINTMDGAIHRVKKEYRDKGIKNTKEAVDNKCSLGIIWDIIVFVWLVISSILTVHAKNYQPITNGSTTLLFTAFGLLITSGILLASLTVSNYYSEQPTLFNKAVAYIRILNVMSFFSLVLGILAYIYTLGML